MITSRITPQNGRTRMMITPAIPASRVNQAGGKMTEVTPSNRAPSATKKPSSACFHRSTPISFCMIVLFPEMCFKGRQGLRGAHVVHLRRDRNVHTPAALDVFLVNGDHIIFPAGLF